MRHRVAGGVVAGRDEEREEIVELVIGDRRAVGSRSEQLGDDVCRWAPSTLVGLLLGELKDL